MTDRIATAPAAAPAAGQTAPASGENLVEVKNLVKYFPVRGGLLQRVVAWVQAVENVSFNVRRG